MSKRPLDLTDIVSNSMAQEPTTSAKAQESFTEQDVLKPLSDPISTKNISVRVDMERYKRIRQASYYSGLSHKDVMIQAFDLWWAKHGKTITENQ